MFVRLVLRVGVTQVIDIREHPTSRRPGFAKTSLSKALGEVGVEYVHVREAGNPFGHDLEKYAAHLDAHPQVVTRVADLAQKKTSLLLCFERNAADCHRSVLAPCVAIAATLTVVAV